MITLQQYMMGRDTQYPYMLTPTIVENAKDLLSRVNKLLEFYGNTNVGVTSGWRPPNINAATKGASATSKHMEGNAIDLSDDDGSLDDWCMRNQQFLVQQGLYLEHPSFTPRWCHLQRIAPRSGNRVFRPK